MQSLFKYQNSRNNKRLLTLKTCNALSSAYWIWFVASPRYSKVKRELSTHEEELQLPSSTIWNFCECCNSTLQKVKCTYFIVIYWTLKHSGGFKIRSITYPENRGSFPAYSITPNWKLSTRRVNNSSVTFLTLSSCFWKFICSTDELPVTKNRRSNFGHIVSIEKK